MIFELIHLRMKVLVTGADGFIGSHLTEMLLARGYSVKALCLYNPRSHSGWLTTSKVLDGNLEIIYGDIRDRSFVEKCCQDVSIVFHLAALISIPYSYVAPASYIDTNIHGTLNILEASRRWDLERVVITSTSEVYGSAEFVPITEEHPLKGQSPYAASKIGADQLALSFYRSFGTPVTVLRPFNTYGPRQSTRAVIPSIIVQALKNNGRVKLGSLEPTRDFNYVKDTCDAFISVSQKESCIGETINSASCFEISVKDVVNCVSEIIGCEIDIIGDNQRVRPSKSEVNRLFGDNSKIRRLTGWCPMFGGLDGFKQGLKETIDWFSVEDNLRHYNSNDLVL